MAFITNNALAACVWFWINEICVGRDDITEDQIARFKTELLENLGKPSTLCDGLFYGGQIGYADSHNSAISDILNTVGIHYDNKEKICVQFHEGYNDPKKRYVNVWRGNSECQLFAEVEEKETCSFIDPNRPKMPLHDAFTTAAHYWRVIVAEQQRSIGINIPDNVLDEFEDYLDSKSAFRHTSTFDFNTGEPVYNECCNLMGSFGCYGSGWAIIKKALAKFNISDFDLPYDIGMLANHCNDTDGDEWELEVRKLIKVDHEKYGLYELVESDYLSMYIPATGRKPPVKYDLYDALIEKHYTGLGWDW